MAKLKVLFCSSEVVPFAKTGGLADVAGSLPLALEELGVDVRIVMPKYSSINIEGNESTVGKNIKVYFIDNPDFYSRPHLYGDKYGDYADNLERFLFYSHGILDIIKEKKFVPDILHSHDWQAALPIILQKTLYKNDPVLSKIKTILTIHNLAYQGLFPKEKFPLLGIGWEYFTMDALEFYGKINLLKGGIIFADLVTTVSETYAKEILTPEFGCGLEGVLQKKSKDLSGIINGIDYNLWDPSRDKAIYKTYGLNDRRTGKEFNKMSLQKENKLKVDPNVPLIGLISRLADQKGADLISEIIEEILHNGTQFILLGTGDHKYHVIFEEIAKKYKTSAAIHLKFDAVLAQKIYAASDLFLIPSRYEPCGLGQLISLKYGTVPIVRRTGGLADTIKEFNPKRNEGNGFVFEKAKSGELLSAIKRALKVYGDKKSWDMLTANAMGYDFSWAESAKKYVELYKKALAKRNSEKAYAR